MWASGSSISTAGVRLAPSLVRSRTPNPARSRRLPTAAVSTYAYVNPVVAVSLGALFLGERLTPATLAGGVVVVVSVAMLLINRTRSTAAAAAGERPNTEAGP